MENKTIFQNCAEGAEKCKAKIKKVAVKHEAKTLMLTACSLSQESRVTHCIFYCFDSGSGIAYTLGLLCA